MTINIQRHSDCMTQTLKNVQMNLKSDLYIEEKTPEKDQ